MTILITGGAGFIGGHLARFFRDRASVRILDNLRTGSLTNLEGTGSRFIHGDILDRTLLREAMAGVDYVFHLGAMVSVPESVSKPAECEQLNSMGTIGVLEAAAEAGVRKVFFASSAAVYGDNPSVPKTESMLPEPRSPYALTKLAGEHWCRFFHDEGRVPTVCLRFFNVFGPRQDPAGPYAAAVPIFIGRALRNEPLTIFGDGEQTRDFIPVADIVSAIAHVTLTPGLTGVFNAGCGATTTINDLARRILHLTGSASVIEYRPDRAGDVKHSRASINRLLATGFQPSADLDAALLETIEFFRNA